MYVMMISHNDMRFMYHMILMRVEQTDIGIFSSLLCFARDWTVAALNVRQESLHIAQRSRGAYLNLGSLSVIPKLAL